MAAAIEAHSRRLAVFLGSELRRAETRFCPRRNGDSSSTSRSTRRASSSSSRGIARASARAGRVQLLLHDGGLLFRAISSGQLSSGIAELFHYSCISRIEIDEKSKVLHRQEPGWVRARCAMTSACHWPAGILRKAADASTSWRCHSEERQRRGTCCPPAPRKKQGTFCNSNATTSEGTELYLERVLTVEEWRFSAA